MKNIAFIAIVIAGIYFYLTYFGETPDALIQDITLTNNSKGKNLGFDFATPVRYLGHFPENYGEVLQIRLRSISFSDFKRSYSVHDKIVQSGSEFTSLIDDIRYEGNVPGGPFIVIKFTKAVNYKVNEGGDLRSMNISFSAS